MSHALFVNLKHSYPEIVNPRIESEALRNATCGWWVVGFDGAQDLRYLFGVFQGQVVSAYQVEVAINSWPTMPTNAPHDMIGRRYIPAQRVTAAEWKTATGWPHIDMTGGAFRYGEVTVAQGILLPNTPQFA